MKQTVRNYSINMLFGTTLTEKELEEQLRLFMYSKSLFGKFNIMYVDTVIETQ